MTEILEKKTSVVSVAGRILTKLSNSLDSSAGKATLANLRHSIGRPLSESIGVWSLMLEDLPEEFLGKKGWLTMEEQAILTTLQFYALHQQGESKSVLLKDEESVWQNIGYSLSSLRKGEETLAVDRRFNALITSATYEELTHHLRQMIQLLKSKTSEKINYAKLANDLFWFLRGYDENLRLNWSRSYYRSKPKGENENEK